MRRSPRWSLHTRKRTASDSPLNVVLTGAAGFLGSHLVDRLLADGDRVVGIDNLTTGSRANLETAGNDPAFAFVEADVSHEWTWASDLDKPELIVHFASPASPIDYGGEPLATMAVNALGAMHGVELARATGARLLFASTSEIYGDPFEHPQPETLLGQRQPGRCRAPATTNRTLRRGVRDAAVRTLGIDARIVRILTLTDRACSPTTAASSRTSAWRPCAVSRWSSTATAGKREASAT